MAQLPTSRGVNNTAFSPNSDIIAQLTGTGGPVPGAVSLTYAATQAVASILQYSRYVEINGSNTTSATTTVTTTTPAAPPPAATDAPEAPAPAPTDTEN